MSLSSEAQSDVDWYERMFQVRKQGSVERALEERQNKLKKAIADGDFTAQTKILNELGVLHLRETYDYGKSMDFLIRALSLEDSLAIRDQQVFTYLTMARVFNAVSNYEKSKEMITSALSVMPDHDDVEVVTLLLNDLGKTNMQAGNTVEAQKIFKDVLNYKESKPAHRADALFNLGRLFTMEGKYKQALEFHKQALSLRRAISDKQNEANSLNDIGLLYRLMKATEKSRANHVVALELRQQIDDKRGIAESYNNLGILYYEEKDSANAIRHLELALQSARESQNQDQLSRSYEYLSECFEAMKDYRKALHYKELYIAIRELIQGESNEHKSVESENRYKLTQQETKIDFLETDRQAKQVQLETERQLRYALFGFIALSLLVLALLIFFYMQKRRSNSELRSAQHMLNKQNLELQELNATKDKFFSIISHDLKGPLNSLSSFSNLLINYTESLTKEEIKTFAMDFDKSLKNLFALLENLLEWSRSQTGNIDFSPERFDFSNMLAENKNLLQAQALQKGISIQCEAADELFISAHKNSVNTVVRNLISNAIKFTPSNGSIQVGALKNGREITVSIADNGVGMSQDVIDKLFRIDAKHSTKGTANEKGTGLGLILCREFVEKNGGRIWVKSTEGEGSVFYFTLPYDPETAAISN